MITDLPGMRSERRGDLIYLYLDDPTVISLASQMLLPTLVGKTSDGESEVWVYDVSEPENRRPAS